MGLRVRLKKDVDISGFSWRMQVILRALKEYGMFVADNGGGTQLLALRSAGPPLLQRGDPLARRHHRPRLRGGEARAHQPAVTGPLRPAEAHLGVERVGDAQQAGVQPARPERLVEAVRRRVRLERPDQHRRQPPGRQPVHRRPDQRGAVARAPARSGGRRWPRPRRGTCRGSPREGPAVQKPTSPGQSTTWVTRRRSATTARQLSALRSDVEPVQERIRQDAPVGLLPGEHLDPRDGRRVARRWPARIWGASTLTRSSLLPRVAGEERLELAPRTLGDLDELLLVPLVLEGLLEHLLVVLPEPLQRAPGLGVAEPQLLKDVPGQLQAGEERLPDDVA